MSAGVIDSDRPPSRGALLAVALVAGLPMLWMAATQRLDFDSWWHVFIAREYPWARFWRDVEHNAHPPVFFLLLRAVAQLGPERLVYRAISLLAALVCTYAVGRIAGRVLRAPALAVPCALAFGLAMPTVVMASAVRGYMLSLAFLLIAFRFYLELIDPRRPAVGRGGIAAFAAALAAAILTHYGALFALVAMGALPVIYAGVDRHYRRWLVDRPWSGWLAVAAAALAVGAVVVAVYLTHLSRFHLPMAFLAPYFPSAEDWAAGPLRGAASFLFPALVAEIDLFSPVQIGRRSGPAAAIAVALLVAIGAGLVGALRRRPDWPTALAPVAMLVQLLVLIAAAALAGRYPFGGFLRHQFILFPFAVLAAFALVDTLIAGRRRQGLVAAALVAGLVLNGVVQWQRIPRLTEEPGGEEVARFTDALGDSQAVYVDHFSLIHLFAGTQPDTWAPQVGPAGDVEELPVIGPRRTFTVYRDMRRWRSDLGDAQVHRDLRGILERSRRPSIDIFALGIGADTDPPDRAERVGQAEAIIAAARAAGLRVERLVLDRQHRYARLRLDR